MSKQKKDIEQLLGKVPPQAKEFEVSVLGMIMMERLYQAPIFETVSGILKPECFYDTANNLIFQAMCDLRSKNQTIDALTVMKELREAGNLEKIGGPLYLTKISNDAHPTVDYEKHAKIVYEKFKARELIRVTEELNSMAYDESVDVFDLLSLAESSIKDVATNDVAGGLTHISDVLTEAIQKIEEWKNQGSHITGISSGFELIDKATRGWQPGDFIVIGARPAVGKSAFALNIVRAASQWLGKKSTIGLWSLEMKAHLLVLRMIAAESKTVLTRLQTGKLSESDLKYLYKGAISTLSELGIYFDQSNTITVSALIRKARYMKRKKNLGLIVIDYLQLVKGDSKSGNREQEVAAISRDLKNLAQELNIPIIALSQLSRESGGKGISWEYGPPVGALRESGAIEQDADVIIMLWEPSEADKAQDPSLEGKRRARIVKQRNGVLITQEFDFKSEIQLFEAIQNITPGVPDGFRPVNRYEKDEEPF